MGVFNIFKDPPTPAEVEAERREDGALTAGDLIAIGPGFLGVEVLAGAAVNACRGEESRLFGRVSEWEPERGAVGRDWSESIFAEAYAGKVRAMGRELTRGEAAALRSQVELERAALGAAKGAGEIVGNIAQALLSQAGAKGAKK